MHIIYILDIMKVNKPNNDGQIMTTYNSSSSGYNNDNVNKRINGSSNINVTSNNNNRISGCQQGHGKRHVLVTGIITIHGHLQ